MVYQLVYRSRYRASSSGVSSVIREIIAISERNNARHRITGFLIFDKTHFVQVLEGAQDEVEATFAKIAADPRHDDVTVVSRREAGERAFADWAMGGCVRTHEREHIFSRYGLDLGQLGEAQTDALIGLAQDIAAWEAERQKTKGLSGH